MTSQNPPLPKGGELPIKNESLFLLGIRRVPNDQTFSHKGEDFPVYCSSRKRLPAQELNFTSKEKTFRKLRTVCESKFFLLTPKTNVSKN